MPAPTRFDVFTKNLVDGVHNFSTAALKVVLLPAANPPVVGNTVLANLTQIANGNGYTTNGSAATSATSQATAVAKVTVGDVVFTAGASAMAAFRYAVLYNDTPTSPADPLIAFIDYGSAITLQPGETYTVDFDGSAGLFTV